MNLNKEIMQEKFNKEIIQKNKIYKEIIIRLNKLLN